MEIYCEMCKRPIYTMSHRRKFCEWCSKKRTRQKAKDRAKAQLEELKRTDINAFNERIKLICMCKNSRKKTNKSNNDSYFDNTSPI